MKSTQSLASIKQQANKTLPSKNRRPKKKKHKSVIPYFNFATQRPKILN